MKLSLRIGVACLVAGLFLGTGCQQPSSAAPPPDLSTAPAATMDKYSTVTGSIPSKSALASPSPGITVSGSPTASPFDVTVTFSNYSTGVSSLNGSLRMTGDMGATGGTIHEWGTLTLSGARTGTVALDITLTMTTSPSVHMTTTGTVTIDGTTYTVNTSL